MHFADRVCAAVSAKDSRVVVGLDPAPDLLPPPLRNGLDERDPAAVCAALLAFNKLVIDRTAEFAVAVKPQLAFYEAYGSQGLAVLEETNRYAHRAGLLVICDGKRGDIGSTAQAYARAFFARRPEDGWGIFADALTVNAYLGTDGLRPFADAAREREKGIFVLVRTTNPSSVELQDLEAGGAPFHEAVAGLVLRLSEGSFGQSGFSCLGAVAGATFPAAGRRLRQLMPKSILLVPGVGAQGGSAADTGVFFTPDGQGALVSASRSIIGAGANAGSLAEAGAAIGREAMLLRDGINEALASRGGKGS
ncbi:MAG: orotidine-5'-phosphate decarboxylase [Patescibacteria group bacterium]